MSSLSPEESTVYNIMNFLRSMGSEKARLIEVSLTTNGNHYGKEMTEMSGSLCDPDKYDVLTVKGLHFLSMSAIYSAYYMMPRDVRKAKIHLLYCALLEAKLEGRKEDYLKLRKLFGLTC